MPGLDLPELTIAKDQPPYRPLRAYRSPDGLVVTRWRLTFWERLMILLYADLWLSVNTFNHPLQPVRLDVDPPLDLVVCRSDQFRALENGVI